MSNVARTSIAAPAEQATAGRDTCSCLTCGDVAIPMRVVRAGDDGLAPCVTAAGDLAGIGIEREEHTGDMLRL